MDWNAFSWIFTALLALNVAIHLWLYQRHIAHVRGHRDQVPAAFSERISIQEHQTAADYTVARTRFARVDKLAGVALLLLWTFGGGLNLLDTSLANLGWPPLVTGVVFLLAVSALMGIIDVPFSAYRTFVIEGRFGFNRTTWQTFLADLLKQSLLLMLIGAPLAALILWLYLSTGTRWWAYAWLAWLSFSFAMMWAYPRLIAPLFNKFRPLDDDQLRQRIQSLLQRNGFASKGIFIMDGSRRSSHGNAYFAGLGANKRIVFFDTLLKDLDAGEVEAVLAHELGHYKRRHVVKQLLMGAALSLLALAVLGWLSQQPGFYHGLGMARPSGHAALMLFMLTAPVCTFLLQPVLARVSRRHEFEADEFAAQEASAGTLAEALVKLYRENAATLTPDPVYSAFHDSHPPAPVRIARLNALAV